MLTDLTEIEMAILLQHYYILYNTKSIYSNITLILYNPQSIYA